jgi:hypothetical protein
MLNLLDELTAKQAELQEICNKKDTTVEEVEAATRALDSARARAEAQKLLDEGKDFDADGREIPVNEPVKADPQAKAKPFKSLGDQLRAIIQSSNRG